jgi:hypothetical protein
MEPSYKCAECGASATIDENQVITRECEDHADKGVILDMGAVKLTGVGALSNE